MKIIDFEDAVVFGNKIRSDKVRSDDAYRRYPPMGTADRSFASSYHNTWFLLSITDWLGSSEPDFADFMLQNHDSICMKVDQFTSEYASII